MAQAPLKLADAPDVLTAREAARVLRIGRNKVYDLVSTGELFARRSEGRVIIPKRSVEKYLGLIEEAS
jgi:excisionase family DNA binding protein